MSKLSFIEKLQVLLEVSKSSIIPIIVFILLVILGFVFITTNKENAKKHKMIYISLLLISTLILVIFNFKSLGKIFDYMMNNLFIAIYFPNFAIYFAAIIATNIILWISIFNYKTSKLIKKLNVVVYIIINYILALILSIVNTNKLDIFSQDSIYTNKKAAALIELSSNIFMVWIIFLILYKIILTYIRKDYRPKVKKVIVRRKVKMLPENFIPTEVPEYIFGKVGTIKTTAYEKFNKAIPEFDELLLKTNKENLKLDQEKEEKKKLLAENKKLTEQLDKMLTVEDYKLLLKILSEQKQKEKVDIFKQLKEEKVKEEARIKQEKLAEEAKLQQKKLVEEAKAKQEEKKKALEMEKIRKEEEIKLKALEEERKAREQAERDRIEAQKQEIIRLEEERKESLRKEQQRIAEIKLQEQLKIEEVKKQEIEKEQEKFTELEMLYRSVR